MTDNLDDSLRNDDPMESPWVDRVEKSIITEPMIVFDHVSISFGENAVLKDVSFNVGRGQTLCILGRSGVGKSVALRLLMGFLTPDSGSIRVEGQEIVGLSEDELQTIRKRITLVFQNGALFDSLTVRENIAFPLREREGLTDEKGIQDRVDHLLDMVGAEEEAEDFPASLSTGRKRAVAIARALAAHPDVVLYDEPTTMVDPIIARRMAQLIQKLKSQFGLTSIVVTHDMRFATELADSVVFLHLGEASFFGPLAEFLKSDNEQIQEFLALDKYQLPSEQTDGTS